MHYMRLTLAAVILSLAGTAAYAQDAVTATCKDGTNWSGARRGGACRGHGGVQAFGAAAGVSGAATPAQPAQPAAPAAAPPSNFSATTGAGTVPYSRPTAAGGAAVPYSRPTAAGGGTGQVWVNTKTKVYHCSTDYHYAKTKAGTYMTETAAAAAGNRPSRGKSCS